MIFDSGWGRAFVLLAISASATSVRAGARVYTYGFSKGDSLEYKVVAKSKASMGLPDGRSQNLDMKSNSTVVQKVLDDAGDLIRIESRTLAAESSLNGAVQPMPDDATLPHVFQIHRSGRVESEGEAGGRFLLEFPARPLDVGDSWTQSFTQEGDEKVGPGLQITYTLQKKGVPVPDSSGKTGDLFAARVTLQASEGRVTLRTGEGSMLFDPEKGILLRSSLKVAYDEVAEIPLPGADGTTQIMTSQRTMALGMSHVLVSSSR